MSQGQEEFAFAVEGMHCAGCVRRVKGALEGVPSVELDEVVVGAARGRFDPAATQLDELREAIRKLGFTTRAAPAP